MAVHKIKKGGRVTMFGVKLAADTSNLVVNDNLSYEDVFNGLYWDGKSPHNMLVEPTYNPSTLVQLTMKNNILLQCIEAMEVNIDGTGHSIEPVDESKETEEEKESPEKKALLAFFESPWPDMGMIKLRRKLRVDLESTGNGYLEIIRNMADEVVFIRLLDTKMMRLVKLDEPVEVEKEIERGGQKVKAKMFVRERRYAMKNGEKLIYFREFNASRDVNRNTGAWEKKGALKAEERGSEVIHFVVNQDPYTSYGLPRWINQIPSVLGSRKAEEFNLTFFDAGGTPPAVIFVQGGSITEQVTEQIRGYFQGGVNQKHRVAVVEIASTAGSIDAPGNVKVSVERFGDTAKDVMFSAYDDRTENHVRTSFRLPPLFLGKAADYNFATAMTSYMVTEAQVFAPERDEFDEVINKTLLPAMGVKKYKFKSKPITLKNVEIMMKGLELAQPKVDGEEFIHTLNEVSGLSLTYSKEAEEKNNPLAAMNQGQEQAAEGGKEPPKMQANGMGSSNVVPLRKADLTAQEVIRLVSLWTQAMKLEPSTLSEEESQAVIQKVEELPPVQRSIFDNVLASKSFVRTGYDVEGMSDLAGCCAAAMVRG